MDRHQILRYGTNKRTMSAEEYLDQELNGCYQMFDDDGITRITGIEHSEICRIMESYAREYHAKEMEGKLKNIHESHIDEAAFQKHKTEANALDKRYGFIWGAKWLLNHLKEDKG